MQTRGRVTDVDVVAFKKDDRLAHLLDEELNSFNFTASRKSLMRSYLRSPKHFRSKEGFMDNEFAKHAGAPDLSHKHDFQATSASSLIYGRAYDPVIKQCLKQSKSVKDTFGHGQIGTDLQQVHDATSEDASAAKSTDEGKDDKQEEAADKKDAEQVDESDDGMYVDDEYDEAKARWWQHANQLVSTFVRTAAPGPNEAAVISAVKETPACKAVDAANSDRVVIIYNSKQEGQCKTQPHIRMPVHRQHYMARRVQSLLKIMTDGDWGADPDLISIHPKAIYLFLDAFKNDNVEGFNKCFSTGDSRLQRATAKYFLTYEESSLKKRKSRENEAAFAVVELMTAISSEPLDLVPKACLTFPNSSNLNNHVGPLVTTDPRDPDERTLSVMEKRQLLGDALVEGGGRAAGCTQAKTKDVVMRKPTDIERVSFHANSVDFYKQITHSFCASGVVDCTPLSENCAMASIMPKKPCTLICYTEAHAQMIEKRLRQRVFAALTKESCEELHGPMAASDLAGNPAETAAEGEGAPEEKKSAAKKKAQKRAAPEGTAGEKPLKMTKDDATGAEGGAAGKLSELLKALDAGGEKLGETSGAAGDEVGEAA
ncbi:unnamed protein product [Prorocentrum cordatum]|uniref:Uncharacterized protein n=1 Tax=Prorocentrum cordatum TaxID=2364126 RepID=A0ABN9VKV4_9DINO|nr:unnamed protein product [Polarella glacialis]